MGFFDRLFRRSSKAPTKIAENVKPLITSEGEQVLGFYMQMKDLLNENEYTPKSGYRNILADGKTVMDRLKTLDESGVLPDYCRKNGLDMDTVKNALETYENYEKLIDEKNEKYVQTALINEREYLDNILKDVDPQIDLDEDQRRVILTDEDYCLVIAGAGAGKTTTVAAKVKYLVEKKGIDPKQILVVSFTNKAVNELKDKINKDLHIDAPIATFHSTGNAIIHKQSPEKLNIVDSSKLYYVVQDYFRNSVLKNEDLVNNLILFFSSYFDAPFEGKNLNDFFNKIAKSNFSTMRSDLEDYKKEVIDRRSKKAVTIQNEVMRSYQEVQIANFLYLNGIDYEYEPLYQYDIQYARKPYTPDFVITQGDKKAYLEHFGITEDGRNNRFSADELEAYKKAVNDKVMLHRLHKTTLIYTFSAYNDQRPLLDHLREQLERNGFTLHPRSNKEIVEKLVSSEENRYIRKLAALITRFITNFKTNGYTADEFSRMYHSTQNVRSKLFLNICNDCYLEYERYLKQHNAVDFEDMINESARILREVKEMKQKLDFKYVFVDEYQDISQQRFDLVKALNEVTDAKIIAVGDDWQSIYAFSGSDITLFTKFAEKMGYAKQLKIVKTYRNSQEVIDIAGNFIQKNKSQISKALVSKKTITDPVIIYTYDGSPKKKDASNKTGRNYELAHAVETALKQIKVYNSQKNDQRKKPKILLLGRFGFDGDLLERSGLFEYKPKTNKLRSIQYPDMDITFMTAHASKGLGYDDVIIINGKNETYGFPSKIEDDPVLAFVIRGDRSIDYAEERRLFYVAMTRTKNRVYIVAPEQNPSEFLIELKHDYKNVVLKGYWNEEPPERRYARQICPICGYPMQYRYKNSYGLRLWICTNEPEVCGFMTNEIKARKLSICKCDQCRTGYLIVKPSTNNNYFLGCTNYKSDKTGCNNVMTRKAYYEMMHYTDDEKKTDSFNELKRNKETTINAVPKTIDKSIQHIDEVDSRSVTHRTFSGKTDSESIGEMLKMILSALEHVSSFRYYGKTTLILVLRGTNDQRLLRNGLNAVPEFGYLKDLSYETVSLIVDWMIEQNLIHKTNHPQYPVLHPTYEGRNFAGDLTKNQLQSISEILSGGKDTKEQ